MASTLNCDEGSHAVCYGYVAPLVYSAVKPCECVCHDGDNPRDFTAALNRAIGSYYRHDSFREPSTDLLEIDS